MRRARRDLAPDRGRNPPNCFVRHTTAAILLVRVQRVEHERGHAMHCGVGLYVQC